MTNLSYRPAASGGWIAVVHGDRALLLGGPVESALLDSASIAVRELDGFALVLDLLTRSGLSATPPFALLEWTRDISEVRTIVRGGVFVLVTDAAGDVVLSGEGLSTWVERVIVPTMPVTAITVTADAAVPALGIPLLPLAEGTAWTASLVIAPTLAVRAVEPVESVDVVASAPIDPPAIVSPPQLSIVPDESTLVASPLETPEPEVTVIDVPPTQGNAEPPAYDYLFGATMMRSIEDAAVRPEGDDSESDGSEGNPASVSETDTEAVGDQDTAGDHAGDTVLTSDIAKLRRTRGNATGPKPPAAPVITIVLPDGARETLGHTMLVGRAPSVSKVSGGSLPQLVMIGSGDQDISRTHVRIAYEGETVVVTDLHSRNGTFVVMPGREPQKLRAGEPTSVMGGTVIDLGGGMSLTVEESVAAGGS